LVFFSSHSASSVKKNSLSGWLHKLLTLATGYYLCLDGGEHALFSRSKSNMNVTPDLGYKCWFPKTSHFPVSNTMTFLKYKHTSASFSLLLFETQKGNLVAERPSSVFYFERFFLPDISNLSRWSGSQRLLKLGIDVWKGHTGVCKRGLWIRKYQQAGTSIMGKVLMQRWNILEELSRKILFYFSCGGVTYCIPGDIPKISIKLSLTQKLIMGDH